MVSIRWFSMTNAWLDAVVVVEDKDAKEARLVIQQACDDFWNDDAYQDICYGDLLEMRLHEHNIKPITVIYHDSDREDSEYEDMWGSLLDAVYTVAPGPDYSVD